MGWSERSEAEVHKISRIYTKYWEIAQKAAESQTNSGTFSWNTGSLDGCIVPQNKWNITNFHKIYKNYSKTAESRTNSGSFSWIGPMDRTDQTDQHFLSHIWNNSTPNSRVRLRLGLRPCRASRSCSAWFLSEKWMIKQKWERKQKHVRANPLRFFFGTSSGNDKSLVSPSYSF